MDVTTIIEINTMQIEDMKNIQNADIHTYTHRIYFLLYVLLQLELMFLFD